MAGGAISATSPSGGGTTKAEIGAVSSSGLSRLRVVRQCLGASSRYRLLGQYGKTRRTSSRYWNGSRPCSRHDAITLKIAAAVSRACRCRRTSSSKSALVRCLAQVFGGSYFERLLTKFRAPEELFGPISLQELAQDRFGRLTAGKLPEAEVRVRRLEAT
jgi:hypothetical protein